MNTAFVRCANRKLIRERVSDNRKLTTRSSCLPAKMVKDLTTIYRGGEGVLKMDQYEMIRTGCRVYGKNISEMARMTGHSRNTIKKAIRGEPWDTKRERISRFRYLTSI